jgi:hypothetical protein
MSGLWSSPYSHGIKSLPDIDEAHITSIRRVAEMHCFVVDKNKNPLSPCHPAVAMIIR